MNPTRFLLAACLSAAAPLVLAQQPAAAGGSADDAKNHNSMCTGCHTIPGYQASFPRVYHVPKISGQSAKYIEAALTAYKKGERSHPTMSAIAAGLTDKQISNLAAYYSERGSEPAAPAK